jgi:hypothetical protein
VSALFRRRSGRGIWLLSGAIVFSGGIAQSGCRKKGKTPAKKQTPPALPSGPSVLSDTVERRYEPAFVQQISAVAAAGQGKKSKAESEKGKAAKGSGDGAKAAKKAAKGTGDGDKKAAVKKRTVTIATYVKGEKKKFRATFDISKQVFSLSLPRDISHRGGGPDGQRKYSPRLQATFGKVRGGDRFRSASMLAFKAKQFDDGLYAAVELAADRGAGRFPGRKKLHADLAAAVKRLKNAAGRATALGLLGAAADLGGASLALPKNAEKKATALKKAFLANPLRAKPIGFYTWSEKLAGVFRRDRMLQQKLSPQTAKVFARALAANKGLFARYKTVNRLPRRLTNGQARPDLYGPAAALAAGAKVDIGKQFALFPPSRAYETDLIKKLYKNRPIPAGFKLADEMIRRIRAGKLNLAPGPKSGWYDYQTYALEPLVVPEKTAEAKHLKLGSRYKKELAKLFKALLALTRETHIKQLEIPKAGAAGPPPGIHLRLAPQLSQEPLATYYLRRADAYGFVRGVLEKHFGPRGLKRAKRLTASGPVNVALLDELKLMEALFYGAYLNTAVELGLEPEKRPKLGWGPKPSLALYRKWKPQKDPDVGKDIRMMVPVFYDIGRRKTKIWAILGVTTRPLSVHYSTPPKLLSVVDAEGNAVNLADVKVSYKYEKFTVVYPVMAELYTNRILNRKEFRALCDRYKTRPAIVRELQK